MDSQKLLDIIGGLLTILDFGQQEYSCREQLEQKQLLDEAREICKDVQQNIEHGENYG